MPVPRLALQTGLHHKFRPGRHLWPPGPYLGRSGIGEASSVLRIPFVAFAAPPTLAKNIHHLKKRRKFGVYSKSIRHAKYNLKIAVDPKIKLKALRFHKSQLDPRNPISFSSKKIRDEIKHFEYFNIP